MNKPYYLNPLEALDKYNVRVKISSNYHPAISGYAEKYGVMDDNNLDQLSKSALSIRELMVAIDTGAHVQLMDTDDIPYVISVIEDFLEYMNKGVGGSNATELELLVDAFKTGLTKLKRVYKIKERHVPNNKPATVLDILGLR